jgi:glycosyltransferase involved in cell wall biosynthesis
MKIALLVPMYNEEESLPLFWEETQTVLQTLPDVQFEYVFVNDGSTDGTLAQLKELAQKNPNVKVSRWRAILAKKRLLPPAC